MAKDFWTHAQRAHVDLLYGDVVEDVPRPVQSVRARPRWSRRSSGGSRARSWPSTSPDAKLVTDWHLTAA